MQSTPTEACRAAREAIKLERKHPNEGLRLAHCSTRATHIEQHDASRGQGWFTRVDAVCFARRSTNVLPFLSGARVGALLLLLLSCFAISTVALRTVGGGKIERVTTGTSINHACAPIAINHRRRNTCLRTYQIEENLGVIRIRPIIRRGSSQRMTDSVGVEAECGTNTRPSCGNLVSECKISVPC